MEEKKRRKAMLSQDAINANARGFAKVASYPNSTELPDSSGLKSTLAVGDGGDHWPMTSMNFTSLAPRQFQFPGVWLQWAWIFAVNASCA